MRAWSERDLFYRWVCVCFGRERQYWIERYTAPLRSRALIVTMGCAKLTKNVISVFSGNLLITITMFFCGGTMASLFLAYSSYSVLKVVKSQQTEMIFSHYKITVKFMLITMICSVWTYQSSMDWFYRFNLKKLWQKYYCCILKYRLSSLRNG